MVRVDIGTEDGSPPQPDKNTTESNTAIINLLFLAMWSIIPSLVRRDGLCYTLVSRLHHWKMNG